MDDLLTRNADPLAYIHSLFRGERGGASEVYEGFEDSALRNRGLPGVLSIEDTEDCQLPRQINPTRKLRFIGACWHTELCSRGPARANGKLPCLYSTHSLQHITWEICDLAGYFNPVSDYCYRHLDT